MAYEFNADEIFEMAEQIERNGAKFYKDAAETVSDQSYRDLLLKLSEMEVMHEATFKALRTELTDEEKKTKVFDPEEEAVLYLKALADTRIFFEKEIDTTSAKEILKSALTAEKDSIVFYLGMKALMEAEGQDKVDKIIAEEMDHIKIIGSKLRELKA
jgi:rubrerythrin